MALLNCSECKKEISSLATVCPGCGAQINKANKTSPLVWWVLAFIIVGVFFFTQSRGYKEKSLPPLPIEVGFREALLGPGLVLKVKNKSSSIITTLVTLKNPTTQQEKSYRLDIPSNGITEVGHSEGWVLAHGDIIKIYNVQYQSWNGSIP